jgi:hypothetical protein
MKKQVAAIVISQPSNKELAQAISCKIYGQQGFNPKWG